MPEGGAHEGAMQESMLRVRQRRSSQANMPKVGYHESINQKSVYYRLTWKISKLGASTRLCPIIDNINVAIENLKNVLRYNKKLHILKYPLPKQPPEDASKFVLNVWNKLRGDTHAISDLMLASVSPRIQASIQRLSAYDMISNLKERYHLDYNMDSSHSLMSHIRDIALKNPERVVIMRKKLPDIEKACIPIDDHLIIDILEGTWIYPSDNIFKSMINDELHLCFTSKRVPVKTVETGDKAIAIGKTKANISKPKCRVREMLEAAKGRGCLYAYTPEMREKKERKKKRKTDKA
ncbi:hypothetical protein L1987_13122 [Smallanthus sonchifolius]|uniref:Uncharacterized protein n=1 Tax=Smallanthus sonchifolius TaxID=185202 RepID=A0ACB9JHR7_9ASTR|nr:hypothetical protein L1987_13122 [Smallanthus sonchifolius]